MRLIRHFCLLLCLTAGVRSAAGFALLGPFASWMKAPLAYQLPDAIGGPMTLGQGYRWNVPVITYGFDQSFLDYFGTNGVASVESAIQILNDLPPASQINLSNYALDTRRINFAAQSQSLQDLKSSTLPVLLEQMGLAHPTASVWCLRNFSFNPVEYTAEIRSYDPTTWEPLPWVNSTLYDYLVAARVGNNFYLYYDGSSNAMAGSGGTPYLPPGDAFALPYTADQTYANSAVADNAPGSQLYNTGFPDGAYILGLTKDDVGGLRYQFSTNNIALENLIPGVRGAGANASNYITTALRPGLDKITFQRMDWISSNQPVFATITNQYVDSYITNGVVQQQTLERVITQPDILFTANYTGMNTISRTGTTNWVNNGAPLNDGPGVIQPPIAINFNRFGPSLVFEDPTYTPGNGLENFFPFWATYDGTTNAPIVFPIPTAATNFTEFHFLLSTFTSGITPPPSSFTWNLVGQPNALFSLQTSTNLSNWITYATITNLGGTFTYSDFIAPGTPQRYFRTVPQ